MAINKVGYPSLYYFNRYESSKETERKKERELQYENLSDIQKELVGFDEFFRDDELYNPDTDYRESTFDNIIYSPDDVPLSEVNYRHSKDVNKHNAAMHANPISCDLPSYIIMRKSGRKIFLERLCLSDKLSCEIDEMMMRLPEGYNFTDAVNIIDYSICDKISNQHIQDEAIKLLKEKYPIEYVLDLMTESKLKNSDGKYNYSPGVLTILSKYPEYRDCFITLDSRDNEIADNCVIQEFPALYELCNKDSDLRKIIFDSRLYTNNINTPANISFLNFAEYIYGKQHKWNDADSKFVKHISTYPKSFEDCIKSMIFEKNDYSKIEEELAKLYIEMQDSRYGIHRNR